MAKGKPVKPQQEQDMGNKGLVIKGKPMPKKKKRRAKNLAEHTRGLKAAVKY